jgi:DNA-binding NtrC family response regulator
MKLFVHVFDDHRDAAERCFRDMKGVAPVDVLFNGTPLTDRKLGFQVTSVGSEPIQVLVSFSPSVNQQELGTEIDLLVEELDLLLIDDHYDHVGPLAGQSFILPSLVHKMRRHANMLPVFCLFTQHYVEKTRLATFLTQSDALRRSDTIITGIPKDSARLLEVVRWSAFLKRAAQAASAAQAQVKAAGLDRDPGIGPGKTKHAGAKRKDEDSAWLTGQSDAMKSVESLACRYARSDHIVLILGESGSGKSHIAELIHQASPRCNGPYQRIDLGTISDELIESELFGHEEGAFSGATKRRTGLLEALNGGTAFLDEIGNMPFAQQRRLLRFLDDGCITPVGSSQPRRLNVRVIAATNKDLEQMVRDGSFMDDLRARLWVLPLVVPPLRERQGDIPLVASHLARRHVGEGVTFSPELIAAIVRFHWPTNVRQMENMMVRASTLREEHETVLLLKHFPDLLAAEGSRPAGEAEPNWIPPTNLGSADWNVMTEYVEAVVEFCRRHDGVEPITLTEVGLYAYRKKLEAAGAKHDCAGPPERPQTAFINHLNKNKATWARFLSMNSARLGNKAMSVFFLTKGIKSAYERD